MVKFIKRHKILLSYKVAEGAVHYVLFRQIDPHLKPPCEEAAVRHLSMRKAKSSVPKIELKAGLRTLTSLLSPPRSVGSRVHRSSTVRRRASECLHCLPVSFCLQVLLALMLPA